jgi:hypothetical protein
MTKRLRKRSLIVGFVVLLVSALISYGYALPTLAGHEYLKELKRELTTVNAALIRVADTNNLSQFSDPDVSLGSRVDQTAKAKGLISDTRKALDTFNDRVSDLPRLPLVDWYGDYQRAVVKRTHAQRLVLQSHEVLDQYERILAFLSGYTPLQRNLDERFEVIGAVDDFDTMGGQGDVVSAMASAIRADADVLRNMAVPKEFAALHSEALKTFDQAAAAFDRLAFGLNIAVNSEIYDADAEITAAAIKNKTADKNMLVALVDSSSTFLRLIELPEKVDYVER